MVRSFSKAAAVRCMMQRCSCYWIANRPIPAVARGGTSRTAPVARWALSIRAPVATAATPRKPQFGCSLPRRRSRFLTAAGDANPKPRDPSPATSSFADATDSSPTSSRSSLTTQMEGITEVVRGIDLMDSTPRQIWLQRLLGYRTPHYLHMPVVTHPNGDKLSKLTGADGIPTDEPFAGDWWPRWSPTAGSPARLCRTSD